MILHGTMSAATFFCRRYNAAVSLQPTSLAEHGTLIPVIVPNLIDRRVAAEPPGAAISTSGNSFALSHV